MQGMDTADARLGALRSPASILQSPGRLPPRGSHMNCMILRYFGHSKFQLARLIFPGCVPIHSYTFLDVNATVFFGCSIYPNICCHLIQMVEGLEEVVVAVEGTMRWWVNALRSNPVLIRGTVAVLKR
jgi:hypothetical protein